MLPRIADFLTPAQVQLAIAIYKKHPANLHRALLEQVIQPNMTEINRKLGHENNAAYLAYAVEFALNEIARKAP